MDIFELESAIWIARRQLNVPVYDFRFDPLFQVSRPRNSSHASLVARIGPLDDYEAYETAFADLGFQLINSFEAHQRAADLEHWYPLIADLTPKSKVYPQFPELEEVLSDFQLPVFIKGHRQTAKHDPALSVARTKSDLQRIAKAYQQHPILHWQRVAVREFIELRPLPEQVAHKVKLAMEYRTFWWKGELVGAGPYWSQYASYEWTAADRSQALEIAQTASKRLKVPFLVIDLAKTQSGEWTIIECNDAQESGYNGVDKAGLWRKILRIESRA